MQGVTSTGNTENRGTSGEGSSTGTTQGQMQGGRSVQQEMIPIHASLLDDFFQSLESSDETEERPITSRQATGSNTTESIQSQKGQCTQEFNLPELRYQATKDFFRYIEELIDAKKPGASETKTPCSPVPAAESAEDTFDSASVFDCTFDRTISNLSERSHVRGCGYVSREKNTLPLCLMLVQKTTKVLDGLIEELRAVRKSGLSETGAVCDPGEIENIAAAMHQSFQKLEANKELWTKDALPLCQAIVKEIHALGYADISSGTYFFMEKVMGPVYAIAYNGALADLKQQFPDDSLWRAGSFCLLVDISQHRTSSSCSAEKGNIDLMISNLTMFRDLFQRNVVAYSAPLNLIKFYTKCNKTQLLQEIKQISKFLLSDVEKMKRLPESDATESNDGEVLRKCKGNRENVINGAIDDLASQLSMVLVHLTEFGIHHMTM